MSDRSKSERDRTAGKNLNFRKYEKNLIELRITV